MNKQINYKITVPLFNDEASKLFEDMPNLISELVAKKQEAREKFNRLDTIINGGVLREIGAAFGQSIYARFPTNDADEAEYLSKRLGVMMGSFLSSEPEEIVIGDQRYHVVLKERVE